ncbi:MAG: secretin N-terminal domain-containing protein, partial [Phycisphaerae bacterium]
DGDDGNRARSPKPRRTPVNPRARKALDRRRAAKRTPPAAQGRAGQRKTPAKPTPNQTNDQANPANLGEPPPVVEVDTEPIKFDIPPEERTYQFSFENVDYKQLLDAFSRMSGLAIVGDPPPGKVTFKTTEVMDFKTALSRLKLLLFKHRDNYWLVHNDDVLEVTRITEMIRDVLEPEDIYPNVAAYRAANRDKTDLVMLIYSPDKGSVQDLAEIRDFLPDYVRSATLEDPEKNAMYIFALVRDIDKFLDLVALFDQAGADPRIIKKIPVVEVTPSEAIQALGELMDLAAAPTPRRTSSKRSASPAGPTREIKLFPDNAQRVIIVRALPSDIAEIERLLPFIDVELGDEFAPVIISLTYITAGEIMPQLTPLLAARPAETQARPNPRAKRTPPRRTPRGRTAAAAPAQSGDVTVVPEPRTNTLIVVGSEKGVARVRQIVAILDVPGKGRAPQFVKLEHVAANETATWIQQMIGQIHPGGDASRPFSATPDARDNTIILVGNPIDVEQAVKLIAQKDRKGAKPDLHKHRLTHALPSEVAAMLTRLDAQASGAPPPPVRRTSKRKGRKVSRPTPRRGTQASGKFIGNDDLRMIYVICTDDEWESDYLPQIVAFDEDASPIRLEKHRIELTQADPTDVINTLIQVLGAGGATLPVMTAVKDAILVVDATPNQLERIEALVPELDIDPGLERKIFPIAHADPNDVRDVVLAMISANSPRPAPRRAAPPKRGRRKGKTPPRRITPAQPTDDIRMVPVGKSLMVSAPADKMPEIQDLIAQVDVPADDERDIRVYPFADSIDVQDLADTLGKLYGGKSVRPGRKGARPTPVGSTGVIFVAQPRAGKLLVSAPVDDFPKIEEKIQLLATESQDIEIVYEFIPTLEGTADTVVSLIEPILRAKISNLRTIGVLPQPTPGKAQQGQNLLTIQADPQGDRIIISAPRVVVAEARALVQQIDRPTDDSQRVFRTVLLEKTNPQDMARTIQAMITGQKARPVPAAAQRKKGRAPARGRVAAIRGDDLDVVVTPAPGGSALVLAGAVRDVETVEGWIKTMDRDAVGTGKIVKLYDLQGADVEQVADMLMAVVDTAATSARRPAGKAPKSDSGGGFFDMFDSEVKRKGKDLYISGDTFAGTLLVAATPAKMREVDDIVGQFLPDETGVTRIPGPTEALPYMTYELACTDAYDAAYALSGILDVLWPYENKPQVESVPFMDNLIVIKGDPEHFGKVEDLIKEHVDKCGDGKAVTRSYLTAAGTGMTAKDGALMLKAQLEAMGYEVDVLSLEPEDPTELEEVKISPCHLPPVAFASIRSALMAVDMQDPAESTPSQEAPSQENQAQDSAEQVLRRFADAQQAAENEPAKEKPPAEPEKPKLRIVFANNTGQIVLEGASVAVSEAERLVESIKKELEDVTAPPEIRIFRLAHISVTKAADILEEMFNDRRRARQLQQIAAQQRRAQQQQAQRQRQQQQQAAKGEKKGQRQPAQAQPPQPAANLAAQMPEWNVTVYPNPRDRTLIIKAATEAFPRIINLLKKIDKDPKAPLDYKIFTLKNLIASDVEEQLKAMLGLDRSRSRARRPGGGRGTARPGAQPGQDNLLQMEMPGGAGAIAAEEITLSSNPGTNSILVMAPKEAMELVERFITDMEELNTPQFVTQTYEMKHADVTDVVTQVEKFFKATKARPAAKGGGQGFDPLAVNAPMFLADARTNTLIVRALEIDLPKIEPLISQLDVPYAQGAVREYALTHVGADQMAATLQKIYATKKNTAKGGKSVNIVADADANMIFVAAPPAIQKDIADRIASADRIAAGRMAPKVLTVNVGKPSSIAAKISEALGAGRKGKAHLSIIGDDASKRLIVTAPDEVIPQIQSLLTLLDQPPSGLDLRIYPLQYAQAQAVLTSMNEMVLKLKGQVAGKGIDLDVFSATADERSNSLVVMGGPTTFLLVE